MTELQDFFAGAPVSVMTGAIIGALEVSTEVVTGEWLTEGVVDAVSIYEKMPLV